MRTVTLVLLVAVLALPLASAETYRISGQATYSDNMPVMLRDVYVECPPGEVDCYQYRGASAITDANGMFLIAIEVEQEDDGTEIYLQLRGENFTHVIDLDTFRNTSEGKMTQNIRLSQDGSGSGFFGGLGCCMVLFGLVFMSTLLRTVSGLATPRGRAAFQGYREPDRHNCPVCNESVAQHNLVKHLIFEHDYDPMDAGEAAGLVMRKSWSSDGIHTLGRNCLKVLPPCLADAVQEDTRIYDCLTNDDALNSIKEQMIPRHLIIYRTYMFFFGLDCRCTSRRWVCQLGRYHESVLQNFVYFTFYPHRYSSTSSDNFTQMVSLVKLSNIFVQIIDENCPINLSTVLG